MALHSSLEPEHQANRLLVPVRTIASDADPASSGRLVEGGACFRVWRGRPLINNVSALPIKGDGVVVSGARAARSNLGIAGLGRARGPVKGGGKEMDWKGAKSAGLLPRARTCFALRELK